MKHPTPRQTMTFTRIQIHQVRNPTARIDKANIIAFHTASLIRRRITLPFPMRKNKGRVPKDPTPYFKIFVAISAFLQIRA